MPKLKTKSSAKKRFKLTASGKIKRKHAFKSHILTKKETKRNGKGWRGAGVKTPETLRRFLCTDRVSVGFPAGEACPPVRADGY